MKDFIEALKNRLDAGKIEILDGEVSAHNKSEQSISVMLDEGVELEDIKLKSASDGNAGIIIWPSIGSPVVIGRVRGEADYVMLKYSEIDEISIELKDNLSGVIPKVKLSCKEVDLSAEKITLNGGENFGLAKVKAIADRLNLIEQDVNSLKSAFKGWVVVASDGGAALKSAAASWASSVLAITNATQLENDKIKH